MRAAYPLGGERQCDQDHAMRDPRIAPSAQAIGDGARDHAPSGHHRTRGVEAADGQVGRVRRAQPVADLGEALVMSAAPLTGTRDSGAAIALALERERRRVADELHDTVIQQLVLARILIDRSREQGADDELDRVRQALDDALEQMRSLVYGLTPAVLCRNGLCPAIAWLCEQLTRRWRLDYRYRLVGDAAALPQALVETLVQGARELMTNVGRHAHASSCEVVLRFHGERVELIVRDDGIGVDPRRAGGGTRLDGGGFGLLSLRARSEELGGGLRLGGIKGGGTMAVLCLPRAEPTLSGVD